MLAVCLSVSSLPEVLESTYFDSFECLSLQVFTVLTAYNILIFYFLKRFLAHVESLT